LVHGQGMAATLLDHRAGVADRLGAAVAIGLRLTALVLRVEEHRAVEVAARGAHLPVPDRGDRNRQSANVCHGHRLPGGTRTGARPPVLVLDNDMAIIPRRTAETMHVPPGSRTVIRADRTTTTTERGTPRRHATGNTCAYQYRCTSAAGPQWERSAGSRRD